jgi:NADPH-dependent 2,4-dienoyl-CoA reductase/sulfur reductase-like enzyme
MSSSRVPLVVLGAGPAGVAAAHAAVAARVPVTLVDLSARPGGQYHRREPAAFSAEDPGALHHDLDAFQADVARLERSTRFTHVGGAGVWGVQRLPDGGVRIATDRPDLPTFDADAVILATGANERVIPFPGWDLPGVLTIGGAQALLKGPGMRPGRAVVVSGAGPLLLPVAAALARVRTRLVAVADANDPRRWLTGSPRGLPPRKVREGAEYLAALARRGVRLRTRTAAIAARGDGRVEEVVLARLARDWTPIGGSERTVPADALATSHGFVPDIALAVALGCRIDTTDATTPHVAVDAQQATSVAGVWAAGEVTGIGGADVAAHEGGLAGLAAARALDGQVADRDLERAIARRRADAAFLRTLDRVLSVGSGWTSWLTPDTILCRCEEVSVGTVDEAIARREADDLRSIKLTTRCGMGHCQARMCGANVAALLTARTGRPPADAGALDRRPVLHPVPLGRL